MQKGANRHLVDIRHVECLPLAQRLAQILVMTPPELLAYKVLAYHQRRGQPKAGTDWRDIAILLLSFSELGEAQGVVVEGLQSVTSDPAVLATWQEIISTPLHTDDNDEF